MEDRYEIRGKIGQGGIGSVYRAQDLRMNREVAIKRISSSPEDPTLQEEATKQLLSEAGALASLQHPNIVTVYDVGADEDGPYVVMEMISGKTLDEIIENAPLTWEDFRELALQTQEALIAAQDLDMIHSDLKPPNIMLTWLPSGRFQVKIVDFGLAVLTQNQSKEEIESLDAVFGSIFFMPPEQFERQVLDARSDLYSMGCVYYQALAGTYPYAGQTANEVMEAHLKHIVKPLQDVRADIPIWVCDWVMWMINRDRAERPESARVALAVFLLNDKTPNPELSRGPVQVQSQVKRPRMITAKATSVGAQAQTSPVAPTVKASPQALAPPSGKPNLHMSPTSAVTASIERATSTVRVEQTATQGGSIAAAGGSVAPKKKAKARRNRVVFILIGVLVALGASLLVNFFMQQKREEICKRLVALAAESGTKEITMDGDELQMLLDILSKPGKDDNLDLVYKALILARPSDGSNFDVVISDFFMEKDITKDIRMKLATVVISGRKNTEIVPKMLSFASSTENESLAIAAYIGIRSVAKSENVQDYMDVIESKKSKAIRDVVEGNMEQIVKNTGNRRGLTDYFDSKLKSAKDENVRQVLKRLLALSKR